jgi:succinate-semialdehyde dehydrogenase/glutarate-semialdehyde dehydrogenase
MSDLAGYPPLHLFIGGEWIGPEGRDSLAVLNPADESEIGRLPVAALADLDRALEAAAAGFEVWRRASAYDRAKVLHAAAALMRERAPAIGRISTLEQGKLLAESTAEAFACADIFDWFAEEARRAYGRIIPSKNPGVRHLTLRQPIGPVAAFSPWNFPTTIPSRKLAAALAAGCSVVIKPSEETPGSALALAHALDDAGLPKGVLNVVFGDPATISAHLIASPVIRKISFTGSTRVGKSLSELAARVMKPTTMELGGHAPVLVFEDADIDLAVRLTAGAKFRNAGQICIAPTRFFVHESVHDAFVKGFASAIQTLPLGPGLDPGSRMGPLANGRRPPAIQHFVEDAVDKGATLVAGGEAQAGVGYFWKPTLLADVPDHATVMSEEPFGPLAVTRRFSTFEEAITQANRLPYGLAAYAFTRSARTMREVGEELEAGMVGINFSQLTGPETPFGGVKESGHGSEGGSEGLEAYLLTKYVAEG